MKVNIRTLATPYMAFAIIWIIGLFMYLLEWSDAFPNLSLGLFIFLSIGTLLSIMLGVWLRQHNYFAYRPVSRILSFKTLFLINAILWILNFGYSRVPLISILFGVQYSYTDFGIPILIVFVTCYNSFLCIYAFHCYLTTKEKKYLFYYLTGLFFFILAYSRGLIMINLASTTFLWLAAKGDQFKFKHIVYFLIGLIVVLYSFGYAGNIRTAQAIARDNNQGSYKYDNEIILKIASASTGFEKNFIPNEFFWTYVYIASPISNLQLNVSKEHYNQYEFTDFVRLVINETWYETISKRLGEYFPELKRNDPKLVIAALNVSTVFARSYMDMGYLGLCIMLLHILSLPIIYIKVIGVKSQYLPVATAIMCSIYFFSSFDNMFTFVGTGPQLLFPLLFEVIDRVKRSKNR